MTKCPICETRPIREGRFCASCTKQYKLGPRRRPAPAKPLMYMHYKGYVVAVHPSGDKTAVAKATLLSPDNLPKKANILDLNQWCEGFDRSQIKKFKATLLALAMGHN